MFTHEISSVNVQLSTPVPQWALLQFQPSLSDPAACAVRLLQHQQHCNELIPVLP